MKCFFKVILGLILVASVILFSTAILESFLTSKELEIKVTKLERVLDEDGGLHYFIHTKEEIFKNENNSYHWKSNQESLMKLFEKDKTYKVKVVGYNIDFEIPLFISNYRNIIKIVQ